MKKWIKNVIESTFGVRVYRGWYPRGMDPAFDRVRLISMERPIILDVEANVLHFRGTNILCDTFLRDLQNHADIRKIDQRFEQLLALAV